MFSICYLWAHIPINHGSKQAIPSRHHTYWILGFRELRALSTQRKAQRVLRSSASVELWDELQRLQRSTTLVLFWPAICLIWGLEKHTRQVCFFWTKEPSHQHVRRLHSNSCWNNYAEPKGERNKHQSLCHRIFWDVHEILSQHSGKMS